MYHDVGQLSKTIAMGITHWNITTHYSLFEARHLDHPN
jgi:hypothetical protein